MNLLFQFAANSDLLHPLCDVLTHQEIFKLRRICKLLYIHAILKKLWFKKKWNIPAHINFGSWKSDQIHIVMFSRFLQLEPNISYTDTIQIAFSFAMILEDDDQSCHINEFHLNEPHDTIVLVQEEESETKYLHLLTERIYETFVHRKNIIVLASKQELSYEFYELKLIPKFMACFDFDDWKHKLVWKIHD